VSRKPTPEPTLFLYRLLSIKCGTLINDAAPRGHAIYISRRITLFKTIALLALLLAPLPAVPYSIQTHEELIDLAWKQSIRPILLKQYPTLTDAQIQEAHGFAYGGCAIQDFGYYPFGNRFFSDLTHYVRSGDFVLSLLRNATTPDELAFAIGSLSHYLGDTIGHSAAVNLSVPIEFPKLERRYGPSVNYAEDPHAHVQTEFAFDINQLSKRRFAPSAYLRYVGLQVPSPLLHKAFFETYGLNLPDIIGTHQTSMRIYRFAARRFLPDIARAETILHKKNFPADIPSPDLDILAKDLAQASAENNWEKFRRPPGIRSHLFAGFIFILPKVGTLKLLAIRGPNEHTEDLYIKSVNRSIQSLRLVLNHFDTIQDYLPNRDLDTGLQVKPGGYSLTDETYARLLAMLTSHPDRAIPAQLKHDLIDYYADPLAPITTKKHPAEWAEVQANLKTLQTMKTVGDLDPAPDALEEAN
jgi:Zinc dependent phospholipase C